MTSGERRPVSLDELLAANPTLAENLALACASFVPRLRSNGQRVAAIELDQLCQAVVDGCRCRPRVASSGLQRTNEQASVGSAHTDQVPLAHDYRQAGARLGVSERTVRRLVTGGALLSLGAGRRRLISEAELVRYTNEGARRG